MVVCVVKYKFLVLGYLEKNSFGTCYFFKIGMTTASDFFGVFQVISITNRAAVIRVSEEQPGGFKNYFSGVYWYKVLLQ